MFRLGADKTAVRGDFCDGIAHIRQTLHLLPVSEIAAGGLRPAFQDMTRQRTHGQLVEIIAPPAKGVNAGAQCDGAINAAAGHDNIGA